MRQIRTASLLKRLLEQADTSGRFESQFTIDWLEYQLDDAENLHQDHDYAGAVMYRAENVLDIMKEDHPDRPFFQEVVSWCSDLIE